MIMGVLYIGDTFNARIRAVYWRAHEWQRRCEAKGERCARAAKQSLALLTDVPGRRILGSLFPQSIGLSHERLSRCSGEGNAVE